MVMNYRAAELEERRQIAEHLIKEPSPGLKIAEADPSLPPSLAMLPRDLVVSFAPKTAPKPLAMSPAPDPKKPLPKADVVVVTYTQPEADALVHVLMPGVKWSDWYATVSLATVPGWAGPVA